MGREVNVGTLVASPEAQTGKDRLGRRKREMYSLQSFWIPKGTSVRYEKDEAVVLRIDMPYPSGDIVLHEGNDTVNLKEFVQALSLAVDEPGQEFEVGKELTLDQAILRLRNVWELVEEMLTKKPQLLEKMEPSLHKKLDELVIAMDEFLVAYYG